MIDVVIGRTYVLDYTNHEGRRDRERKVEVLGIQYGTNQYHTTPGLIILARDVERGVERTFAADGIHDLRPS